MILPPTDVRLLGGPGSVAAAMMKSRMAHKSQSTDPYQNKIKPDRRTLFGIQMESGRQRQAKARAYYFEGQTGAVAPGLKAKIAINSMDWLMTGMIDPSSLNIERNMQSEANSGLPSNYYLGFGNKVKSASGTASSKYMASRYSELREFGYLSNYATKSAMSANRNWSKILAMLKMKKNEEEKPMPFMAPPAPGEYQLGNMQGARVRAFNRRQEELLAEAEKKKLHRVETTTRTQKEAPNVERASTR